MGRYRHGANGADLLVKVPLGTVVSDAETGRELGEILAHGARLLVARGGEGGAGNVHFKSSTHQAPEECKPGKPGEDVRLRLDLKILADVGLVGFPSAGKSSILREISRARPKVAAYHFTTLHPILGTVVLPDAFTSFRVADIPGIIEGAHEGAGLGFEFMRHIERAKAIVLVVDMAAEEGRDPAEDYRTLLRELEARDPALLERPRLVVASKMDLPAAREKLPEFVEKTGVEPMPVCAADGTGLEALVEALVAVLKPEPRPAGRPDLPPEAGEGAAIAAAARRGPGRTPRRCRSGRRAPPRARRETPRRKNRPRIRPRAHAAPSHRRPWRIPRRPRRRAGRALLPPWLVSQTLAAPRASRAPRSRHERLEAAVGLLEVVVHDHGGEFAAARTLAFGVAEALFDRFRRVLAARFEAAAEFLQRRHVDEDVEKAPPRGRFRRKFRHASAHLGGARDVDVHYHAPALRERAFDGGLQRPVEISVHDGVFEKLSPRHALAELGLADEMVRHAVLFPAPRGAGRAGDRVDEIRKLLPEHPDERGLAGAGRGGDDQKERFRRRIFPVFHARNSTPKSFFFDRIKPSCPSSSFLVPCPASTRN